MISLFTWNDTFLTRIPSIDEQHQRLVELINDLAELVISSDVLDPEAFSTVRNGLLGYVGVHFNDEETLMREVGLDPRHIDSHRSNHKAFISEALAFGEIDNVMQITQARNLANYLVHWLAYHILDVDQSMARQISAVRDGMSPAESFEIEARSVRSSAEPLLAAMNGLFYMVSERNRELRALNSELEQRVKERTVELEQANRQLQLLSTQDDLTGLPNRRFALLSLNQLWLEKERYGSSLSVLMIDADHFKEVNDRFGHPQGDALLRALAERLRRSVRASDIVCRLGGDEFLVICPRSSGAGIQEVAKKILAESKAFFTPEGAECWNGSLSIGLAEAGDSMAKAEDLIEAADLALYDAKRKGRGRIC